MLYFNKIVYYPNTDILLPRTDNLCLCVAFILVEIKKEIITTHDMYYEGNERGSATHFWGKI